MTRKKMARLAGAADNQQIVVEGGPLVLAAAPTKITKKDQILVLLRQQQGASLAEMADALGWLPHTTRAALTGLRKKGYEVIKSKVDTGTRYSLAPAATA